MSKCQCKDNKDHVCNNKMTKHEEKQDGMCGFCADNVWTEMKAPVDKPHVWFHPQTL